EGVRAPFLNRLRHIELFKRKKRCASCQLRLYCRAKRAQWQIFQSRAARLWHIGRVNAAKRSQLRIFYSGRVQGIGFRITAKSTANGFEVVGTIRHLADGRVELVAEGIRDEL